MNSLNIPCREKKTYENFAFYLNTIGINLITLEDIYEITGNEKCKYCPQVEACVYVFKNYIFKNLGLIVDKCDLAIDMSKVH